MSQKNQTTPSSWKCHLKMSFPEVSWTSGSLLNMSWSLLDVSPGYARFGSQYIPMWQGLTAKSMFSCANHGGARRRELPKTLPKQSCPPQQEHLLLSAQPQQLLQTYSHHHAQLGGSPAYVAQVTVFKNTSQPEKFTMRFSYWGQDQC